MVPLIWRWRKCDMHRSKVVRFFVIRLFLMCIFFLGRMLFGFIGGLCVFRWAGWKLIMKRPKSGLFWPYHSLMASGRVIIYELDWNCRRLVWTDGNDATCVQNLSKHAYTACHPYRLCYSIWALDALFTIVHEWWSSGFGAEKATDF